MFRDDEERLLAVKPVDNSETESEAECEDEEQDFDFPRKSRWSEVRIAIFGSLVCLLFIAALQLWDPWTSRVASGTEDSSPTHDSATVHPAVTSSTLSAGPGGPTILPGHDHDSLPKPELNRPPVTPQMDYILSNDWDLGAAPTRREFDWTITDVVFNPDGVYRPMIVINNQYPGPLIRVNEDDTIVVHVKNEAINATSFHWHGIYQNGTAWMDGSVGISQCPIPPGGSFTYEFQVRGQYGTYWYHAHQGVQASDGLIGPLIIHSKEEKSLSRLSYDTDQVVLVSDHYHNLTSELIMNYLASDAENAEPVPNGALINGRGKKNCDKYPGWHCDSTSTHVGYPTLALSRMGDHRLRFINVGAFAEFQIALDEHNFAVVEVDGTTTEPAYYDRFTITPAQRYSIIISTRNATRDKYWLRAKMMSTCFTDPPKDLEAAMRAIISIGNDAEGLPSSDELDSSVESICKDMNTTELVPAQIVQAPKEADATFYLRTNFEIGAWRLSRGVFNSSSWRPDITQPTLHRVADGLREKNSTFTSMAMEGKPFVNSLAFDSNRELVVQSSGIQTIDLVITNFDDGAHPLHLHGYKFFLLGQGHGYYDPSIHKANITNPLRRDTASVEAYGWLWIRVVADNPGVWPFHCHISWHTEAGLLMQLATRTDGLETTAVPAENRGLCSVSVEELKKGGTPDDDIFFGKGD